MDRIRNAFLYIRYKFISYGKKGHGIHSPFVYSFIKHVLCDKKEYTEYGVVESIRKKLLENNTRLQIEDIGAGSFTFSHTNRKIKDLVKISSVSKKYGRLLFRIVQYFAPDTIIELGTSIGMSTLYLASGTRAELISIEKSKALQNIAIQNIEKAGLPNVRIISNSFAIALPEIIKTLSGNFLVFIDGNHRYLPTLEYFNQFASLANEKCIIIIDDINWSGEMRKVWKDIKNNPRVSVTIDLFFMGIVFFNKGITKQNFLINF
ncbi:MAG: class I SAM-dependent methyltransferase [Bacteroidales bacterium]|nr:class I SAM-dependent methyltransferase [Bacteroidales bacterium]